LFGLIIGQHCRKEEFFIERMANFLLGYDFALTSVAIESE
jgi:hypothetical protein